MSFGDLIGYLVVALVILGPWIAGLLKKAADADKKNKARLEERQQGGGASQKRLDDLAARRRAELRAQAQARQQGAAAPSGGVDPSNLTMAERIARARAKAQYENRQTQIQQETPPGREAESAARQRAEAEAAARRRAEQEAQARQQEQRRAAERQDAQRRAERSARQKAEAARRQRVERSRRARESQRVQAAVTPRPAARSAKPQAIVLEPMTPIDEAGGLVFDRQSLRQAIILKEVLDRPVALRDPTQNDALL